MKKIILLIFCGIALSVNAQREKTCYESNVDSANMAYQRHDYVKAYRFFENALKCPHISKYNNGQEARDGMGKCLPGLTIEGESLLEINVGPEAGERAFYVQSKRIRMWLIDGEHRRQGIVINTKQIQQDSFQASWEANPSNTPRDLTIRLYSVDGVNDIDAKVIIHQAAGGLRVNGKTELERSFSWEGGVARFDVTGIPQGEQYQIIGVDTSWLSVQKHQDFFFLLAKSNNSRTKSRIGALDIVLSKMHATIKIYQEPCVEKDNLAQNARVSLGRINVGPQSAIPIRWNSVKGYVDATGKVIGLGNIFIDEASTYTLKSQGKYVISDRCYIIVTVDSVWQEKIDNIDRMITRYKATLFSFDGTCVKALSEYTYKDLGKYYYGKKRTYVTVHRFLNGDFAICYNFIVKNGVYADRWKNNHKYESDANYWVELRNAKGELICEETATRNPAFYEDGIAIVDEWNDYSSRNGRKWVECSIIKRGGGEIILPKEIEQVENVSDGVILFSKEDKEGTRWYGYCDMNGHIIIKANYTEAYPFSEGFALVATPRKGLCFIDKSGQEHFNGKYAWYARRFSEGLAAVCGRDYDYLVDGTYCVNYIDITGKSCLTIKSVDISDNYNDGCFVFNEGVVIVRMDNDCEPDRYNKYWLINKKGEKIIDDTLYDVTYRRGNRIIGVKKDYLWSLVNNRGQIIMDPQKEGLGFCRDYPIFNGDGTVSLVDYDNCVVTVDSQGNYFDGRTRKCGIMIGDTTINPTVFSVNGVYGFFNHEYGLIPIPPQYNKAFAFSEELAAVKIGAKWGFVDKQGILFIPTIFDAVESFRNGYATVIIDGEKYRIDKKGTILTY